MCVSLVEQCIFLGKRIILYNLGRIYLFVAQYPRPTQLVLNIKLTFPYMNAVNAVHLGLCNNHMLREFDTHPVCWENYTTTI